MEFGLKKRVLNFEDLVDFIQIVKFHIVLTSSLSLSTNMLLEPLDLLRGLVTDHGTEVGLGYTFYIIH